MNSSKAITFKESHLVSLGDLLFKYYRHSSTLKMKV